MFLEGESSNILIFYVMASGFSIYITIYSRSDKKKKNTYKKERGAFKGKEGSIQIYKFLLSFQSRQGVA